MPRVAVIGGGIAGLTAAWTLQRRGVGVRVFEASDRLGGKLWTDRADGLLIDAGPDSFLSSKPAALALIRELGLEASVVNTLPDGGGTFILHNGRLEPLPEGMTMLVPAEPRAIARTRLLSPLGKARLMTEYLIRPRHGDEDESVAAFMRRRVGNEVYERLAEPLLSGIFAGDAEVLSLMSTYPRFRNVEREYGGLIRGAMTMRRAASAGPSVRRHTPFVSLQGGLGELIDALAGQIGVENIVTGSDVTSIRAEDSGYRVSFAGGDEQYDGVIVAAPAGSAARMLADMDGPLADDLAAIPYVTSATISLAFHARDVETHQAGRGFVIPRREGRILTAVTWTSSKFGGRVPDGMALLRGFVGRAGNEAPARLPDDQLIPAVRRELADILGITAEPSVARVYRWPSALPQYVLGHPARLARIAARLEPRPTMRLTGAAYRGVGIPDCIADATAQATALATQLVPDAVDQVALSPTTSA